MAHASHPSRLRRILGRVRRQARSLTDRVLHDSRREAARARLRALGRVERVLFVCHGNIYRSPYAEAAFRSRLPPAVREGVSVLSAGFVGPGRPAPAESVALAKSHDLDLTHHRSQLLTPALVKESDLVVVMNPSQEEEICRRFSYPHRRVLVIGDLDPAPIRTREVTDPWNRPFEVLADSAARVTRCAEEMVTELLPGWEEEPPASQHSR